jgi:hypothetical protein
VFGLILAATIGALRTGGGGLHRSELRWKSPSSLSAGRHAPSLSRASGAGRLRVACSRPDETHSGLIDDDISQRPDALDLNLADVAGLHETLEACATDLPPEGVPVMMTSPGMSVMHALSSATSVATSNIMSSVRPSCITAPLRRVTRRNPSCALRQAFCANERRSESARTIEVLAQRPLRGAQLNVPHRYVVEHRVSGNMFKRPAAWNMAPPRADHNSEFALIVEVSR